MIDNNNASVNNSYNNCGATLLLVEIDNIWLKGSNLMLCQDCYVYRSLVLVFYRESFFG